ncbi:MAG TPA: hypothetical protein VJ747_16175 [Stellaceae bacterium]|nr:hypothetical protein [Stellaceae bacterium]
MVHLVEAAAELGHLARQIAGTARQHHQLIAGLGSVAQPGGHGVIDRERSKHAKPDQRRLGAGKAEAQIGDNADRAGDQHHADGDEDGADAHHAASVMPHR